MSHNERPGARRTPSGPLSRLLPSTTDPLDNYGLPSKGETRLNDFKAQESYYNKIVERYVKFCADSGNTEELERQFASMSITGLHNDTPKPSAKGDSGSGQKDKPIKPGKLHKMNSVEGAGSKASLTSTQQGSSSASPELATILHAMRKLRESIVATSRRDLFAQRAYLCIIHASILVRHFESYHPALRYLFSTIHPHTPLSPPEFQEFASYLVLDLACRQGDLQAAYAGQIRLKLKDRRIDEILRALVHDDWIAFWRLRKSVDGHQRALMDCSVNYMRIHVLKCLGRSYFTAEKAFVEKSADMDWDELVKTCAVGWQLDGDKVTIRRPKSQKA